VTKFLTLNDINLVTLVVLLESHLDVQLTEVGLLNKSSRSAPGACIIKHFTDEINSTVQQASAFAIVRHFLLPLTNTPAFYVTELITAVISFMIQAPALGGNNL
jgi:hypothetical protein